MKNYNRAVPGTGVIANETAAALQKNGRNLFAVGNRTHDKAVAFAEKYNIGKVYDSYDEMFTDPDVDIIYITTPHNTHYGFMKKAILNKKHILVEKSITLNSDELGELIALADENNVVIGEAMTVYHMPIYKKLNEILKSGILGRVNLITMNFGSFKEYDMKNRFFNRSLAGGAMLDIGVYALSVIRWFFDSKPDNMLSQLKTAPTGVDEQASLLLSDKEGTDGNRYAVAPFKTAQACYDLLRKRLYRNHGISESVGSKNNIYGRQDGAYHAGVSRGA